MRRVVYLTWGETPRSYGLYRSQVIETVCALADTLPATEFALIAGVPLIHSGLIREKWLYSREIATLRRLLGRVDFERAIIPVPQSFVHPTRRSFGTIFAGAEVTLLPKLRRLAPEIVHCRSMQAAWIAQKLRHKHSLDYRILYDARSLWPEMQFRRNPDPENLSAFKTLEAELVRAVDGVISVNQPMADHYSDMGAVRSWVNYLAASMPQNTAPDPAATPLKLFYAGALHEGGMQDPKLLFQLFARLDQLRPDATLTILTTSPHAPLRNLAEKVAGKAASRISFASARSPAEVIQVAQQHHFACNVYKAPTTDVDSILCGTGFSTKSAEYLAAGVPILVSPHPRAIGQLVRQQQVGHVFDDRCKDLGIDDDVVSQLLTPSTRIRCRVTAEEHFDRRRVTARFADIYENLAPSAREGSRC